MNQEREKRKRKSLRREIRADACERCGATANLERDHIELWSEGGSDDKSNIRIQCEACHDLRHAIKAVMDAINSENKRLAVLQERLKILERENTPELIRQRGYTSYFKQMSIPLPPMKGCRA